MKPLIKSVFLVLKQKTTQIFTVKLTERSNHTFSVCFMNHFFQTYALFNPIQDGPFQGFSRIRGEPTRPPLPKICHTYPIMMKLGTVIPYLKKIQKIYESRDTPLDFCRHQHFSPEIRKFCCIQKYRYRLHFDT